MKAQLCAVAILAVVGYVYGQYTSVQDAVGKLPELSMLNDNTNTIALADKLKDPTFVGTLFAPTNAALKPLQEAVGGDLTSLLGDPSQVNDVFSTAVIPGKALTLADLKDGMKLNTLNGNTVDVHVVQTPGGPIYYVNKAAIVTGNIKAGKSIIHEMNNIVVPPEYQDMLDALGQEQWRPAVCFLDKVVVQLPLSISAVFCNLGNQVQQLIMSGSFESWTSDIEHLLDDQNVNKAVFLGMSSPWALNASLLMSWPLMLVAPVVVSPLQSFPDSVKKLIVQLLTLVGYSEADKRWLIDNPDLAIQLLYVVQQSVLQGVAGVARDMALTSNPWSFKLSDINAPVVLVFQGEDDINVPRVMGEYLAAHLAGAQAVMLAGEGHLTTLTKRAADILMQLDAALKVPAGTATQS
eukprot:gene2470-2773_t